MRLDGVVEGVALVDLDRDAAGADVVEELTGQRRALGRIGDVVGQRRARDEQRALHRELHRVDRRDRAGGGAEADEQAAAAGGVGLIFCQWASLLGIRVIGTVSTDEKAEIAKAHGCTHTIVYRREDIAARVRELTDGAGVPVVFDSIGATTNAASLDSLSRRGLLVCFGTASGPIPPIDAMQLAVKGSLFVTRPALADYIADPAERAALAGELFDHVGSGRITVEINQRYALDDAVQAHRDLESGRSVGSSVFCLDHAAGAHP